MAAFPSVLIFEDKCPQSPTDLEIERDKYFNWASTYQNPLSEAYKSITSVPVSRSILFHVAFKFNWSLRVLTRDPTHLSANNGDVIIPGADFKLDADLSYNLSQQVDLTSPYYYDYITFSIKAPGHQINPDGFIDVFSCGLWLWIGISAAVCAIILQGVSFSFETRKFEFSFLHSLAFILKAFVSQGHDLKGPKPAVRVFASAWAMGTFVTSTLYLSLVVSSVLAPDPPPPTPETLEDLVTDGMKPITVISQYNEVVNYLEGTKSEALQKLALSMSTVKYIVNCQDAAVKDTSIACVAKFSEMQSFLESKYIDKNGQPTILIPKYRSPVIWTGFAVKKASPFRGIVSSFIDQSTAAGFVNHWRSINNHVIRRWAVAMELGDRCSNKPKLLDVWLKVSNVANKNNPNKHIRECFRWNVTDYAEIVKKLCVKTEPEGTDNSSSLDSMVILEHLLIVFQAVLVGYSVAFLCFILEWVCVKIRSNFWYHILEPGLNHILDIYSC